MRAGALVALTVALAGCGQPNEPRRTLAVGHGVTVNLPPGWQRADVSLTPNVAHPREVLAVGTYPLEYRQAGCAHMPSSALEDLGPREALVTLQERDAGAGGSFPPRPAQFGPHLGGPSEAPDCVPRASFRDHWFTFSDRGRRFHVLVAFGPDAPPAVQEEAWAVLDSLQVR